MPYNLRATMPTGQATRVGVAVAILRRLTTNERAEVLAQFAADEDNAPAADARPHDVPARKSLGSKAGA